MLDHHVLQLLREAMQLCCITLDPWTITVCPDLDRETALRGPAHLHRRLEGEWGTIPGTYWLQHTCTIPEGFAGQPVRLTLRVGSEYPLSYRRIPWGVNLDLHFEGQLYVNGEAFCGLDPNHDEVLLTPCAKAGETFQLAIEGYTRSPKPKFLHSVLWVPDEPVRSLYYDFVSLRDLVQGFGYAGTLSDLLQGEPDVPSAGLPASEMGLALARTMDGAARRLLAAGKEWPAALAEVQALIRERLASLKSADSLGALCLAGHCHIDTAWLWRLAETRRKVGRTFSTQLRMMDEFPNYTYVQSAPVAYEACREDTPEVYAQIRQRVAEGRWSPEGAMYVEADCNLIAGESIVRQLLYGKGFFRDEFGIDSKVLWLPDVFGFSGALPQLLKQAGVELFFNTKIRSIDGKPNPYHNYWWEGIDGTRVMGMHEASYVNWAATAQLRSWVRSAAAKGGIQESLVPFGFGDGGGGATVADLELVKRWQKLPFMPELRFVNVHDFVDERGQRFAEQPDETPVQSGQLYLEAHRGTYTSVARIKYLNRHSENRLMEAELWASLAALRAGAGYPARALARAWKKTLLNQFHDILPGSSIRQVYLDAEDDAAIALGICDETEAQAMTALAGTAAQWTVSNSHSHPVSGYVSLPANAPCSNSQTVTRPDGRISRLVWVQDVPAWSIAPLVPVAPQLAAFHWDGVELETPFWRAQLSQPTSDCFANAGVITSLYDKVHRRQLAKGHLNDLQLFADEPDSCEVWEQNPVGPNLASELIVKGDCQVVASGPLTFIFRRTLETGRSLIRQDVCFHAFTPRIDCHTQVDWHERRTMLKAVFPFRIDALRSTAETAFGFHSWENDPESPAGRSRFETPMHRWVSVADDGGGVALLNDGKYGYGASGGTVSLTLLKSAAYAQFHPEPSQANPLKKVTHPQDWADQGPHSFTYALYPHPGAVPDGPTVRESHLLNRPLRVRLGCPVDSLIRIDSDQVVADTLKASEDGDGFVLRLYEALGSAAETSVVLSEEISSLQPCDILERATGEALPGNTVQLTFRPFEVKSLRLRTE